MLERNCNGRIHDLRNVGGDIDLRHMFLDKSRAQEAIVTVAILIEAVGVALASLSIFLIHQTGGGSVAPPLPPPHIDPAYPEGGGASMVILIAMVILFGGAAYFTGRLYGKAGMITVIAGFMVVIHYAHSYG
jgi:hypothetical protein